MKNRLSKKTDSYHDPNHAAVYNFFRNLSANGILCYTSDYVIDEAVTLTRMRLKNHHVAVELADELLSEQAAKIIYVSPYYLPRALEIFRKYSDQQFSFTDCTSFAIMEKLKIEEALAFDRHFTFEAFGLRQI